MFTTLEYTLRMVQTTGESRDFKKTDLEARKNRLMQAIAATFEESLTETVAQRSSLKPRETPAPTATKKRGAAIRKKKAAKRK